MTGFFQKKVEKPVGTAKVSTVETKTDWEAVGGFIFFVIIGLAMLGWLFGE